ncbi:Stk1 family PASTA domain-containing Ser/Thr kinase [Actinotalea sp. Marseille-Q4924]|uniref:Stk1 family PASTA domain-containing Ser/Thr kinase n=1 Tax=Actinotalea sp. Marseille-Q4924 TaxID=2866571 RepID=UPI001CE485CF|nr:Stk1 family PASTA domain-containing Ser/Thr kinase [Actinotalea sp. Marseille-Q4924]
MAATLTDPLIGQVVDGRYEVLSRVARGGMATVYRALDRRLEREVALKIMHPHLADGASGSDFVARFRREARAAARLTHPGVVGVYDQGVDGETSYLTMEFVDGTSLRRRLTETGPLGVGEALATAEAVLDALAVAHRSGVVHRDVKPENVLLATDGRVKVVDFGLARALTDASHTSTGTVLGTVAYLAPELVTQGTSDARTDVYAMGILLFEMLTGRQPFTGTTPIQVAYQHVNSDVPPPSDLVDWLPAEVDELVQCLAARPADERPAEAGAALALVRRCRAALDEGTLARRADAPAGVVVRADRTDGGDRADVTDGDPDETTVLRADPRGRASQGQGGTVALPVAAVRAAALPQQAGAPDDASSRSDDPALRRWRHRVAAVLALIAVGAVLGLAGIWYATAGPGAYTSVPGGLVGADRTAAEEVLSAAGLGVSEVTEVFDPQAPAQSVVAVEPGEGARIPKAGDVALTVSKGPDLRVVPEGLVGASVEDAVAALEGVGLVGVETERAYDDAAPVGTVLTAAAEPGATLAVGSEVGLLVSDGPEPVTILSVVGVEAGAARQQLEADGLVVAESTGFSEQHAAGVVMAQDPAPGTAAVRTDTVTITVSQGPPLVEVPDLVGQQFADARAALERLGFAVVREDVLGGFFGTVRSQDAAPGSTLPKGSTITLAVV